MIAAGAARHGGAAPGVARGRRPWAPSMHLARQVLPGLVAVAAVGGLLLAVDPRSVGAAVAAFDPAFVIPLVLLAAAFYALQGLRWHQLLRRVGVRQRLAQSELVNLAGQTVAAVLPLGDLTRALMASESSGVEFGATAATVTVQELTYTLLLVSVAVPALVHLPGGVEWTVAVVAGVVAVVAMLTVPRVVRLVQHAVARTPGLRRFRAQIETLQRETGHLLAQPAVLAGSVLDLARVVVAASALLLILDGLHVSGVSWWDAALVLAVSYVGGALSLLPGGIGANEASVVGVLVLIGVNPAAAAAAAILQRLSLSGLATLGGVAAYAAIRGRIRLPGTGGAMQRVATVVAPR